MTGVCAQRRRLKKRFFWPIMKILSILDSDRSPVLFMNLGADDTLNVSIGQHIGVDGVGTLVAMQAREMGGKNGVELLCADAATSAAAARPENSKVIEAAITAFVVTPQSTL